MDVYLLVHLFLISHPFLLLWRLKESAKWIRSACAGGEGGEFAGAGSPVSSTFDQFLLNSEEGTWPKTSPQCWEVVRSCQDSDLSESNSKKPFGDRRKLPDAGGFQQLSLSVLQKGRIEQWLDGGVLAPCLEKEITGYEMAVQGLGLEWQAEPRGEYTSVS